MITKQEVSDLILSLCQMKHHPKRQSKINRLKQINLLLDMNYSEQHLVSQHQRIADDIKKIKSGMSLAIENMGDAIPEKERKRQYIESTQLRNKQTQERSLRFVLTGKGI